MARSDSVTAVVMAGGLGTRMAHTRGLTPKPLVPLCGLPLVEILVRQLAAAGITDIRLALRHGAERVIEHFRTASAVPPGIMQFLVEDEPLGTIGPLARLRGDSRTVLVANGDLLSGIVIGDLLRAHRTRDADLTIATHAEFHRLQLGEVVVGDDGRIRDYLEKPVKEFRISSGMYVLEPRVLDLLGGVEWLGFPDLARKSIAAGHEVFEFFHDEAWIDVNEESDVTRAEAMLSNDPAAFGLDAGALKSRSGGHAP